MGKSYTRRELERYVGDISQVAGIKLYEFTDGKARGTRAVDFKTGSGFNFTVLLDRCMDISAADYRGRSLCWRSSTKEVSPSFYQPEGLGWLYGFFAGLLTTCGLTHTGAPSPEEGQGLHGRAANTPASDISLVSEWRGNEYVMSVSGTITEVSVFGAMLRLTRTITTFLGEKCLLIDDVVENIGPRSSPHMILYHINAGFPVLSEDSRLLLPVRKVIPRDAPAEEGKRMFDSFQEPTTNFAERCYYHELAARRGQTCVALVNPELDDGEGFGLYVRFDKRQLPQFMQWKMLGPKEYVCGIEPCTNREGGKAAERKAGRLINLRPGARREYNLEVGVLSGAGEIRAFRREVRTLTGGKRPKFGSAAS